MRLVKAESFEFEGKNYDVRVVTGDEVIYTATAFLDGTQASLNGYGVSVDNVPRLFASMNTAIAYAVSQAREDVEEKKAERWMRLHAERNQDPGGS